MWLFVSKKQISSLVKDAVSQAVQEQLAHLKTFLPQNANNSFDETNQQERPSQDNILVRQENEQLKQQIKSLEEKNKGLITQEQYNNIGNAVVKKLLSKLQPLEQQITQELLKLQADSSHIVERMRQISEDNRRYNLDLVEAFETRLVRSVWEHIFSTEKYIDNIIIEALESGYSEEMFGKLKEACRNTVDDLKEMLNERFNFAMFRDPDGTPLDARRHRVLTPHQQTEKKEQHRSIAKTVRYGVQDANERILYPQLVFGYVFQQPAEQEPETTEQNASES